MSLALLLAALLAAPLHANPMGSGDSQDGGQSADEPPAPPSAPPEEEAPPPPVTLTAEDARVNAATVIQSFVARKSPNGYWPFREKTSQTLYKLKLASIDEKRVKELPGGRHGVPVSFDDAEKKVRLKMEFVVDLTGTEWKVVGMRLRGKQPLRGRKSAPGNSRN